ncbi:MAG: flippase-like domain-containing protein [Bdellovibrionales bacterium]|nr:flippase-like domain-containing protein [Bdellovibrionales bacterium]
MKIRFWIGIFIGLLAAWFSLKDVSWAKVYVTLSQIDTLPILGVFGCLIVTYAFRAGRWVTLLSPLKEISWKESFAINAVGFLSIHILPLRLGEFTRPYLLRTRHEISLSSGMAIVLIERLFDGFACTLGLFIGLVSISEGSMEMSGWTLGLNSLAWISFLIFVPITGFFIVVAMNRVLFLRLVSFVMSYFPDKIGKSVSGFANNFLMGLSALPNARSFFLVSLQTLGIWGVMPLAYQCLLWSFGIDLTWTAPFSIMGIAALGIMVPGPPGFVGTFQLFVQAALAVYGISKSVGFAYAILFYSINMIFVVLIGVMFFKTMATPLSSFVVNLSNKSTS